MFTLPQLDVFSADAITRRVHPPALDIVDRSQTLSNEIPIPPGNGLPVDYLGADVPEFTVCRLLRI
jgi:hypothetical protein